MLQWQREAAVQLRREETRLPRHLLADNKETYEDATKRFFRHHTRRGGGRRCGNRPSRSGGCRARKRADADLSGEGREALQEPRPVSECARSDAGCALGGRSSLRAGPEDG